MLEKTLTNLTLCEKVIKELEALAKQEKKNKACLFNLVIDLEKKHRLPYYLKVIQELIDNFPCRIFLVNFDQDIAAPEATVSLISPKSAPHIVCDFIQIQLKTSDYPILFSFINANLAPDLPIFYLPTEHSDHLSAFTQQMAKVSTRVICDSTDITDISSFIDNMKHLASSGVEVSDLNWARVESWRSVIAKNLSTDILNSLEKIDIIYNSNSETKQKYPLPALFLKGFLAFRLKEKLKETVPIKLETQSDPDLWQGAIMQVTFYGHGGLFQSFTRSLSSPQEVVIHYQSTLECYLPSYVQFTKTESGQSLVKEIRHTSLSQDYLSIIVNLKNYL